MKTVLLLTMTIFSFASYAQEDMSAYLTQTKQLIKEQKNEEALKRCIYYHRNALQQQPSQQGVRLSFALSYWLELAQNYPAAMDSLVEIRDANRSSILKGESSQQEFVDLVAINEYIGQNQHTVDLFSWLHNHKRKTAYAHWPKAKRVLFQEKEYELISAYLGNPVEEYEERYQFYQMISKMNVGNEDVQKKEMISYQQEMFVGQVLELMDYTIKIEDFESTKSIQRLSTKVIDDERIRMFY